MSVAILPARIVSIFAVGWNDFFEESPQIAERTALKLDRCQRTCRRWTEDGHGAVFQSALRDLTCDGIRNIMDICIPMGIERKRRGFTAMQALYRLRP